MIAIVYFVIAFNIWYGLIIFVTMTIYMGKSKNSDIYLFWLSFPMLDRGQDSDRGRGRG